MKMDKKKSNHHANFFSKMKGLNWPKNITICNFPNIPTNRKIFKIGLLICNQFLKLSLPKFSHFLDPNEIHH